MAQWLEHRSCKPGVGSSNLPGGTGALCLLPALQIQVWDRSTLKGVDQNVPHFEASTTLVPHFQVWDKSGRRLEV